MQEWYILEVGKGVLFREVSSVQGYPYTGSTTVEYTNVRPNVRTVLGLQNHTIQRTSLGIGRVDNMHMCVTVQNGRVGVV